MHVSEGVYSRLLPEFILEDGFLSQTGNSCDRFPSGVNMKQSIRDPPSQSPFQRYELKPVLLYSSDINLRRVSPLKQETRLTFPSFSRFSSFVVFSGKLDGKVETEYQSLTEFISGRVSRLRRKSVSSDMNSANQRG